MKRLTWIMGLLLCAVCILQAKERIIERPPFIAWSSNSIEIDKIVMGDTATTVFIKAYYRPHYWIKVASGSFLKDNNGNLYPIRRGIGITLDKEFWMPDSGEAEFRLVFPPIPEHVTSLDFSEGDFEGAYQIWGIQLNKKKFGKTKLPEKAVWHDKKAPLPTPALSYGKAVLKGRILDYQKDMKTKLEVHVSGMSVKDLKDNTLPVNDDGTFQMEIGIPTVSNATLILPYGDINCLIAPNEETDVTINAKELCRQMSHLQPKNRTYGEKAYFKGFLAGLQQERQTFFLDFSFGNPNYEEMNRDIVGKTPEEYKEYMLRDLPKARKQIAESKHSAACKELMNIELDLEAVGEIAMPESKLRFAHIFTHNLKDEEVWKYYRNSQIEVPKGYYDVLKEFTSLNTSKAAYGREYSYATDIVGTLIELGNISTEVLDTDKGALGEYLKAKKIYANLTEFIPLTAEQNEELKSFSSTAYADLLAEKNKKLLQTIEENKKKSGFTIHEVGDVTNEKLFASILSQFKGHAVLVDFWATWCGPCRMANKEILPMKKELKDKDIVYVYVTGETSPKGTWENMIADIHGAHFRVSEEQWNFLRNHLKIEGVPTYFVVDKEGNVTYKQVGFPGVDKLKKELEKALD